MRHVYMMRRRSKFGKKAGAGAGAIPNLVKVTNDPTGSTERKTGVKHAEVITAGSLRTNEDGCGWQASQGRLPRSQSPDLWVLLGWL